MLNLKIMKIIKTMKKRMKRSFILFLFFVLSAPAIAGPETPITVIDVFVEHPLAVAGIPNTNITVFDLSRKDAVKATAPKFPSNPNAEGLAKKWLESAEGKAYIQNLKAAYAGHAKMVSYGALKVPAIVFDNGKFVIYGTTDVIQAVRDYDDYMLTHKIENAPSASAKNE